MLRGLAVILAGATVAVSSCCPVFRRTRKGIIFIHLCSINAYHVWTNCDERIIGSGATNILLCIAAIFVFIEQILTINQPCREIELPEAVIVTLLIVGLDNFVVNAFEASPSTSAYCCLAILTILIYVYWNLKRKPWEKANLDELAAIEHDSLFLDFRRPLNVTGRHGDVRLLQVYGRLLVLTVPYAASQVYIRYMFVLLDCFSIYGIMFSPPVVGGMVQVMKMLGRFIVERQLQKRLKEAMKRIKRRGGKKPSAELLLANVEEEFSSEAGFVTTEFT
ncbi:unnamed protein product [Bursaphelenchus okinawaensis]|uniref:7TM_GPCR_Srx domain-containing protein n=1 Tax=Bursaphelenchus okinawaensis TaxID=465554 RepID=A0A811KVV4_9BILA|nr:unnamed protein product [Bursaphelenchus okinawaensis]CAG9112782.1 unnamed protein product [Bursaphelenchus okinawaensis]